MRGLGNGKCFMDTWVERGDNGNSPCKEEHYLCPMRTGWTMRTRNINEGDV